MTERCCECGAVIEIELVEYSEILTGCLVCHECTDKWARSFEVEVEL